MEKDIGKWGDVRYIFYIYKAKRETNKIFSVVYFSKRGSKKEIEYKEGLSNLIDNITKLLPEYNIRIYYDITTANYLKQYLNRYNIELYMYHFPQFFDMEKREHFGLFGTLIRYLPLFNFKNHGCYQTIIFDLDNFLVGKPLRIIKYFDRNKDERLIYRGRFCYLENRVLYVGMKKLYPIISSLVCQREVLPKEIFINFINECLLHDCHDYEKFISRLNKDNNNNNNNNKDYGKFRYGVDEYFLDKYYLNYYIDNNIPFTIAYFVNDSIEGLMLFIKNSKQFTDEFVSLMNEFCGKYGCKMDTSNNVKKSVKNIISFLDEIKYNARIARDLINIVKKYDRKKLGMPEIYYNCIIQNRNITGKNIYLITFKDGKEYIKYDI